jgi:hypothetical protein
MMAGTGVPQCPQSRNVDISLKSLIAPAILLGTLPRASPQKPAAIEAGYSPKKASQIRLLGFEPYPRLSGRDYGPMRALQTVVGFVETVQNLLIAER